MIPLPYYGLHESGGVWFLHQRHMEPYNLFGIPSPFTATVEGNVPCPHAIQPLQQFDLNDCRELITHPVARHFLPLPSFGIRRVIFLRCSSMIHQALLAPFMELSSPIRPSAQSLDNMSGSRFQELQNGLRNTNCSPVMLLSGSLKTQHMIKQLVTIALTRPRKLIITCDQEFEPGAMFDLVEVDLYECQRLIDRYSRSFREIGAAVLSKFMESVHGYTYEDVTTRSIKGSQLLLP